MADQRLGAVLHVEDDPFVSRLVEALLGSAGIELATAGSVAEAEHLLAARTFDLILLDIGLPDGPGHRLAISLRAAGSSIPIVALSASAMPAERAAALESGCDAFIPKPIDTRTLIGELERIAASAGRTE